MQSPDPTPSSPTSSIQPLSPQEESRLTSLDQESSKCQDKIAQLNVHIAQLAQELTDLRNESAGYEVTVRTLEKTMQELVTELSELEINIARSAAALDAQDFVPRVKDKVELLKVLSEANKALVTDVATKAKQVEIAQREQDTMEATVKKMTSKSGSAFQAADLKLAELRKETETAKKILSRAKDQMTQNEQDIRFTKNEKQNMEQTQDVFRTEHRQMEDRYRALEKELKSSEIQQQKAKLDQRDWSRSRKEQIVERANKQLKLIASRDTLTEQMKELDHEKALLRGTLRSTT
jgi:chromosome segregation ATPase